VLAQAQSGTGKTATYTIGMLQQLDISKKELQGLILVPTRELANQVNLVVTALGDYLEVSSRACMGGTNIRDEISALKAGVHVLVATPGRLWDLMKRRAVDTRNVKVIVLDEADEMLKVGFREALQYIMQELPLKAQVGIFSATMPPEMLEITEFIVHDPVRIIVKKEQLTLQGIRQFYINVELEDFKYETLVDFFNDISISQCVIFCNSKNKVDWLADRLQKDGFPVGATHSQNLDRLKVMERFRTGNVRVLVATDVLARGIDVQSVGVVINYDVPWDRETYLHRIGRSGRFGKRGVAINMVTRKDYDFVRELEKYYDTQVAEMPKNISDYI